VRGQGVCYVTAVCSLVRVLIGSPVLANKQARRRLQIVLLVAIVSAVQYRYIRTRRKSVRRLLASNVLQP